MTNNRGNNMAKVHVERLSEDCIYVRVGDLIVYVDDSTGEQIINVWDSEGSKLKSKWWKPEGELGSLSVKKA